MRTTSRSIEHPILGIGSLLLEFELSLAGFRCLSGDARLAASGDDEDEARIQPVTCSPR
jgi:hypothetical protein